MIKDITDQYLDGLINVDEATNRILLEDCGNDYAWYYDLIQHLYNEDRTKIIADSILKPMRNKKLLY